MPLSTKRLTGTVSLVGGSLSLAHRLHPPTSQGIDQAIRVVAGWAGTFRTVLNGYRGLPVAWGPLGGLGDFLLILTATALLAALLRDRQPRWVRDVEELVRRGRRRTRGRTRAA